MAVIMRLIGRWDNTAVIIRGWCEELRRAITVSEAARQDYSVVIGK